jgi:hypothetical protein
MFVANEVEPGPKLRLKSKSPVGVGGDDPHTYDVAV